MERPEKCVPWVKLGADYESAFRFRLSAHLQHPQHHHQLRLHHQHRLEYFLGSKSSKLADMNLSGYLVDVGDLNAVGDGDDVGDEDQ